ncbi:unnamed protein product [Dicrocoelium dendriticum]|nr:unnamed protein product [Dicrocoelium dendriticum]
MLAIHLSVFISCPGSVMFLFHLKRANQFILHTGDFRFEPSMLNSSSPLATFLPALPTDNGSLSILNAVYLDTTYLSPQYDFPTQHSVISSAVEITRNQLSKDPSTMVVCGMYSIGKERFVYGE